jgi:hypothetical protein
MPRGFIKKSFAIDELVAGQRYYLSRDSIVKTFEYTFVSISGKYETVHCLDDNNNKISFPLYWIKDYKCV